MKRWAGGGIIRSSVATKYQLGFVFQAGCLIAPLSASRPQGTWESAMNCAFAASTSAAKEAGTFALSRYRKPSCGGRIGGTGAPGGGSLIRLDTDSPASGANAAMKTRPTTLGSFPASVITTPPYEWPTRITGPFWAAMVRLVHWTSSAREMVGFWTILTLKPSDRKSVV